MTDMANFYFERECRTPYSECYTILEESGPVGRLDLHFTSAMVHGTLTVAESLTQEGIQEIVSIVDENIIDAVGLQRDDCLLPATDTRLRERDPGRFAAQINTAGRAVPTACSSLRAPACGR